MDAKLHWSSDVRQIEDIIMSQWRDVSVDEKHQLHEGDSEILHPLGYDTNLVVISRGNGLALYFICMTLSALMSLRDQWRSRQLRDIVESLFTFLSGVTQAVRVDRLTWPQMDYGRCLGFFSSVQGKQSDHEYIVICTLHANSVSDGLIQSGHRLIFFTLSGINIIIITRLVTHVKSFTK